MWPILSTRAFKYLRKIDRLVCLQHTDEEVHKSGARLSPSSNMVLKFGGKVMPPPSELFVYDGFTTFC